MAKIKKGYYFSRKSIETLLSDNPTAKGIIVTVTKDKIEATADVPVSLSKSLTRVASDDEVPQPPPPVPGCPYPPGCPEA